MHFLKMLMLMLEKVLPESKLGEPVPLEFFLRGIVL